MKLFIAKSKPAQATYIGKKLVGVTVDGKYVEILQSRVWRARK
jgi:hypothetical protein